MAPVGDIRSFFKPSPRPAPGDNAQSGTAQKDSSAPQKWPSAHAETAPRETSQNNPPMSVPAKRPRSDTKQVSTPNGTNLPPSTSQSSNNSNGSKKVTLNGEQVVLNSDSESDELEELDFSFVKRAPRNPALASLTSSSSPPSALATRSQTKDSGLRKPPTIPNAGRPALSRLVQDAQRDAETQKRIAAGLADLDKPVEEPGMPDALGEAALSGMAGGDAEMDQKKKRLALAIQRTNTQGVDAVYHFFGEDCETRSVREAQFPIGSLPRHGWTANFEDPWQRDQAFLSGFAQQIFQLQNLPTELARWTIHQICSGCNDALSASYMQLLEAHPDHIGSILTPAQLDDMFINLNPDTKGLNHHVLPSFETSSTPKRPLPRTLKRIVQLLQSAAKHLQPESQQQALFILIHVCCDDSVMADPALLHAVQEGIESMLRHIQNLPPALEAVVPKLLSRFTHPILQRNLVTSLPSKSPLTAYFRRHMALAFLIHPTPLTVPLDDPSVSSLIHNHLDKSPDFYITRETDYTFLGARFALLDIAIGPGLSTVPHRPPKSPNSPTFQHKPSISAEDIAFNKEIDALVDHIKLLNDNIKEAGAISDLSRLGAKDCGERLYHRLENAVRIGGVKKKSLFEAEYEAEASRTFFSKWFTGGDGGGSAVVVPTGTDVADDSGGMEDLS